LPRVVPGASLADARRSRQFPRAIAHRRRPTRGTCAPGSGSVAVASPGGARLPRPGRHIATGARQLRQRTARAAQLDRRRLGRGGRRAPRGAAEADYRDVAQPPAAAGVAPLCRACRRLHHGTARFGAAHDNERPRSVAIAAAEAALRGISDRSGGSRRCGTGDAPDPRAAAGTRDLVRRAANARRRSGEARRLRRWRRPGPCQRGCSTA
jgi:hypothetical protein